MINDKLINKMKKYIKKIEERKKYERKIYKTGLKMVKYRQSWACIILKKKITKQELKL